MMTFFCSLTWPWFAFIRISNNVGEQNLISHDRAARAARARQASAKKKAAQDRRNAMSQMSHRKETILLNQVHSI